MRRGYRPLITSLTDISNLILIHRPYGACLASLLCEVSLRFGTQTDLVRDCQQVSLGSLWLCQHA